MNGTDLLRALSHVEENYVREAELEERKRRAGPALLRWGGVAACAAVAVAAAVLLLRPPATVDQPDPPAPAPDAPGLASQPLNPPDRFPPSEVIPEGPAPDVTVDLSRIVVNEVEPGLPEPALSRVFYETHEALEWGESDILGWFGRTDFTPDRVPEDLLPAGWNNTAIVLAKDGVVDVDLLRLGFYAAYSESGSPMGDETCVYPRGFQLLVSRTNTQPFRDWAYWNETVESSRIGGVEVVFTHAVYSYGPYDPETHEPSGYYDWYEADFALEGLMFEIDAQRMTLEEVAEAVASVIEQNIDFRGADGQLPAEDPAET